MKGKKGRKEERRGRRGASNHRAFLIKELVTVTLLVEMPGLIWARQHPGLGVRGELELTGHTHTHTHTHIHTHTYTHISPAHPVSLLSLCQVARDVSRLISFS